MNGDRRPPDNSDRNSAPGAKGSTASESKIPGTVNTLLAALTPGADKDARTAFVDAVVERAALIRDGSGAGVLSVTIRRDDKGVLVAQVCGSLDGKADKPLTSIQLSA